MKVSTLVTLFGLALVATAAPAPKHHHKHHPKQPAQAGAGTPTAVDPADPCLTPEAATPIGDAAPPGVVAGGTDPNAKIIDARKRAACNAQGAANQATATTQQGATFVDSADPGLTPESATPIGNAPVPGVVAGGTNPCAQDINARGENSAAAKACQQAQQGGSSNSNNGASQNKGVAGAQATPTSNDPTPVDPADPDLVPETATPIGNAPAPGVVAGGTDPNAKDIDARAAVRHARMRHF